MIYEHYGQIPAVKINQVAKKDPTKGSDDLTRKDSAATGWIKSWFSPVKAAAPENPQYHGEEHVDLPKGETEKTEELLKEKKGKNGLL